MKRFSLFQTRRYFGKRDRAVFPFQYRRLLIIPSRIDLHFVTLVIRP